MPLQPLSGHPERTAIVEASRLTTKSWSEWFLQVRAWVLELVASSVSILAQFLVQHKADGTHGAVTADSVASTAGYLERGRAVEIGEWTPVPYSAGNFTGNGAMTWTVQIGDQVTFAYSLVGTTMTVSWYLLNFSVGGTPDAILQIQIPEGGTAVRSMASTHLYSDNGTRGVGQADVIAGTSLIRLIKVDASAWTASANGSLSLGQLEFEVQ